MWHNCGCDNVPKSRNKKQIKDLGGRIEELEEDIESERQIRVRLENQRNLLNQELEDMSEKLKVWCWIFIWNNDFQM